jgi:hypothetical protein
MPLAHASQPKRRAGAPEEAPMASEFRFSDMHADLQARDA